MAEGHFLIRAAPATPDTQRGQGNTVAPPGTLVGAGDNTPSAAETPAAAPSSWGPIGPNCATPKVAPPVPPATAAAPVEETSVKEDCKTEAASATAGEEKLKKKKSKKKEEKKEKKKKKKEQAEELARARRKRIEPVAQSKGEGRGQTPVRL